MREFFRIVQAGKPTAEDFQPIGTTGRRLRFPEYRREFEEGISVYDDLAHACEMARSHRYRHGAYIVRIVVPEDGSVEFKQTFAEHHYTIYAKPERVLALADETSVRIPGSLGG